MKNPNPKSDQLWRQLLRYGTHAPRDLVVAYIKAVGNEAKLLPEVERAAPGSGKLTKSEEIASKIIVCLAQQEWLDASGESTLDEILAIAGELDITPRDRRLWRELFDAVDRL